MNALGVVVKNRAVTLAASVGDTLTRFVWGWGIVGSVTVGTNGGFFIPFFQRVDMNTIKGLVIIGLVTFAAQGIHF